MPTFDTVLARLEAWLQQARDLGYRRLLVVSGERHWVEQQAVQIVEGLYSPALRSDGLWVGAQAAAGLQSVSAAKCRHYLGTETPLILFNAFDGFDPDALASISGTLVGGGLLVLLTPALDRWHRYPDPDYRRVATYPHSEKDIAGRFVRWMVQCLRQDGSVLFLDSEQGLQGEALAVAPPSPATDPVSAPCLTRDQSEAVAAIHRVVAGHRRRPLVMTADRGRGKSAALGIAAAQLLQREVGELVVTAVRFDAVQALFERVQALLPDAQRQGQSIAYRSGRLRFLPPDELLRQRPAVKLLMVDEAAAIPMPMLETMLADYARLVFSTTVHGYEGTGRGFQLRFQRLLQRDCGHWHALRLQEPIRWRDHDPLERGLFDALVLDAEIASGEGLQRLTFDQCQWACFSPEQMLAQPRRFRQVFALLVQAHYQTTPGDLRDLLDGPNLQLWVLQHADKVVGVTLLATEGGFDQPLAEAVWLGRRRPRGHLMAQTLAAQSGWREAAGHRYLRVVRIAVHPRLQGQGIGSGMLAALDAIAARQQVDMLGSSFAASPELVRFWTVNGYRCLRLGFTRDASSGSHSLLVGRALSVSGRAFLEAVEQRFRRQWPQLLTGPFAELEPALLRALLPHGVTLERCLDEQDELDLLAFAFGDRGLEQARPALCGLLLQLAGRGRLAACLGQDDDWVLACLLQQRDWDYAAAHSGLAGRRPLLQHLRRTVARLVQKAELSEAGRSSLQQLL